MSRALQAEAKQVLEVVNSIDFLSGLGMAAAKHESCCEYEAQFKVIQRNAADAVERLEKLCAELPESIT